MTRTRSRLLGIVLLLIAAASYLHRNCDTPPAGAALRARVQTARPGELLTGYPELATLDGRALPPVHTQDAAIPFLFSDSPEYLYADAQDTGLAYMRVTRDALFRAQPDRRRSFGVGLYHINKVADPETRQGKPVAISLVVRAVSAVEEGAHTFRNTHPATVRLLKGAAGESDVMPMFAGKACAQAWFTRPNIPPTTITLRPGEAKAIYTRTLPPDVCLSAMLDLEATNAYFLKVYVVFGTVKHYDTIAFAPYGLTIGTNAGTGPYWKRILRPADGTRPFDPADTRHRNKVHLRFVKMPPEVQYLVDETWELRLENEGKKLVRRKGGQRRPFKGDYNVDYTVVIPIRASRAPADFALVAVQRFGLFAGAMRAATGTMVDIPAGPTAQLRTGPEGVLLERVRITTTAPTAYRFHWLLPGGSYGDQAFLLIPLGAAE